MDVAQQRLINQRLVENPFQTPEDVVRWYGAVQGQEYAHAKWALSLRMEPSTTEAIVEQAFREGRILRTHVMRPTWHFVAAEDIRWILELTAPRVHTVNGYMYRKTELDDAVFGRSNDIIATALQGGKHLTRTELAAELAKADIIAEGMRLSYLVMRAELDGIICSGARRGKQFTYALIEERAPHAKTLPREEALAELTRRFFVSHGPATIEDFAWWSGLTKADVKEGLEMNHRELTQEMIGDRMFWTAAVSPSSVGGMGESAHLLPIYDEYTIAYKNHDEIIELPIAEKLKEVDLVVFTSTIVIGGQVVGVWKRTLEKESVVVEMRLFRNLTSQEQQALNDALWRYGEYLGLAVVIK